MLRDRTHFHFTITPGAVALFAVSWLAMFGLIGWLIYTDQQIQQERNDRQSVVNAALAIGCDRENSTRAALRRVLTFAEAASLTDPSITSDQRNRVLKFYKGAIALVPLVPCGSQAAKESKGAK